MKNPESAPQPAASPIERRQPQPDLLAGAARYWDAQFKLEVLRVPPGGFALAEKPGDMLATLVGGCVAACVRDADSGIGGMNHFMLPALAAPDNLQAIEDFMYSLSQQGARKERLEIRLFGGASLLKSIHSAGEENIRAIQDYLKAAGLQPAAEDLGGVYPRRIHYVPATGRVFCLKMRRSDDARIFSRELELREGLRALEAAPGGKD